MRMMNSSISCLTSDRLHSALSVTSMTASVKAIYGEPSQPMAKRSSQWQESCMATERGRVLEVWAIPALGRGWGWWWRVRAIPVGVIEVSDQQTRFVPITDRKKLTGAVLAGIGLGMFLGWRRRR